MDITTIEEGALWAELVRRTQERERTGEASAWPKVTLAVVMGDASLSGPGVTPEGYPDRWNGGPHSRACGINCAGHGRACHRNCPTCGGYAIGRPAPEADATGSAS